jgi:hypothetical protein
MQVSADYSVGMTRDIHLRHRDLFYPSAYKACKQIDRRNSRRTPLSYVEHNIGFQQVISSQMLARMNLYIKEVLP